jgi:hypothetical protein
MNALQILVTKVGWNGKQASFPSLVLQIWFLLYFRPVIFFVEN